MLGELRETHHYDVPLADIINIVLAARPSGVSFEAADPRHAHEWRLFERVRLAEGKILIPGVLEFKTNYIEHRELIAQRIGRYATLVSRESVIAGTDYGYGTSVGASYGQGQESRRGCSTRVPRVLAVGASKDPSAIIFCG